MKYLEDSVMLINFCQKRLQSAVVCTAISNDGYEVTNLISDSDKGFLAYSCIKPPIHIDFTFICDIQVSHVLVWPSVGAQKSSGFELSFKSSSNALTEYKRVSTGYLDSSQSGVLFYRRDLGKCNFGAPADFLQRYIQVSNGQTVNCVKTLRLSILRTENSVPAIGRIEVWGRVSRSCAKDTVVKVHSLWQNSVAQLPIVEAKNVETSSNNIVEKIGDCVEEGLKVPDCFLDPITWNIMIQPIVLPSGVTIDQSTLEKHAKTEATWGRGLSDPFTGIPFNESRKPILASALKARIDKFLLENKHAPDVKSMPRLLGLKQVLMSLRNRSVELSEITPETGLVRNNSIAQNTISRCDKLANRNLIESIKPPINVPHSKTAQQSRVHRLPVVPMCSKRTIVKKKSKTPSIRKIFDSAIRTEIDGDSKLLLVSKVESNLDRSVQTVLSNLQRFDEDNQPSNRDCVKDCNCVTRIFYKLPCNHIVCRDTLTSTKNSRCAICDTHYNSGDPERIHRHS